MLLGRGGWWYRPLSTSGVYETGELALAVLSGVSVGPCRGERGRPWSPVVGEGAPLSVRVLWGALGWMKE